MVPNKECAILIWHVNKAQISYLCRSRISLHYNTFSPDEIVQLMQFLLHFKKSVLKWSLLSITIFISAQSGHKGIGIKNNPSLSPGLSFPWVELCEKRWNEEMDSSAIGDGPRSRCVTRRAKVLTLSNASISSHTAAAWLVEGRESQASEVNVQMLMIFEIHSLSLLS